MGRLPPSNPDSRASATIASSGGGDPPKRPNHNKGGSGMGHYNERYRVGKTYKPTDQRPKYEGTCFRCKKPRHGNGRAADCERACAACGKFEHFGTHCPESQSSSSWKRHADDYVGQTNRNKSIIEGQEKDLSNALEDLNTAQDEIKTLKTKVDDRDRKIDNLERENGALRSHVEEVTRRLRSSQQETNNAEAAIARLRAKIRNQNAPLPLAWATEYPPGPPPQDFRNPLGQQQQPDQSQVPQQHTPAIAYQGHSDYGHPQAAPLHQRVPPQPAPGHDRQRQWRPRTPPPADTNTHVPPWSEPDNAHQQSQRDLPLRQRQVSPPRHSQGNASPSHASFHTPSGEHQDMAPPQLAGSGSGQPREDDDGQERHRPTRG